MNYSIISYVDSTDKIKQLEQEKSSISVNYSNFENLIISRVDKTRESRSAGAYIHSIYWRDFLFSCMRHVLTSLIEFDKNFSDRQDTEVESIRIMALTFFFTNAKFLLDVIKKHVRWFIFNESDKDLYETVRQIRNYLAHSNEKDFGDECKVLVRYSPNYHSDDFREIRVVWC